MAKKRDNMNNEREKRTLENLTENASRIIVDYDRLPNNPDLKPLKEVIRKQLSETGKLSFVIFVCPSYNPSALATKQPEKYISINTSDRDLFASRIPKIIKFRDELQKSGFVSEFTLFIGDNDPVEYVLPIISKFGVNLDVNTINNRLKLFAQSFQDRVNNTFGNGFNVISLSNLGEIEYTLPNISEQQRLTEKEFFKWLFLSDEGPYKNLFPLTNQDFSLMVDKKFTLYGFQGYLVQDLADGILLQTETPWVLRTEMLKSTGAKFPTIYPWIRKEELIDGNIK